MFIIVVVQQSWRSVSARVEFYRLFPKEVTQDFCFFLGWQTELEKHFLQLLAGFHVPFWSSDRLIFIPFRKNEERE